MSGAGPLVPTLPEVGTLVRAARGVGTSHGTALELSILALCLPWETAAIELQAINWRRGCVEVPARGVRRTRMLALSNAALQAILHGAGSAAGRGQAITAGRGEPVTGQHVRLDRLQETLGRFDPDTLRIRWNFHGLRRAGADALMSSGSSRDDVSALLGLPPKGEADRQASGTSIDRAIGTAERWSSLLLSEDRRRRGNTG